MQFFGGDVGKRGLMALALSWCTAIKAPGMVIAPFDRRRLPPHSTRLDVEGDAYTDEFMLIAPNGLKLPFRLIVKQRLSLQEHLAVIPRVECFTRGRFKGHVSRGNEVFQPKVHHIHLAEVGGFVHERFHDDGGLRAASAPINVDRCGVAQMRLSLDINA